MIKWLLGLFVVVALGYGFAKVATEDPSVLSIFLAGCYCIGLGIGLGAVLLGVDVGGDDR